LLLPLTLLLIALFHYPSELPEEGRHRARKAAEEQRRLVREAEEEQRRRGVREAVEEGRHRARKAAEESRRSAQEGAANPFEDMPRQQGKVLIPGQLFAACH
jgi:vacuolar-type H+-ATPase subunit H